MKKKRFYLIVVASAILASSIIFPWSITPNVECLGTANPTETNLMRLKEEHQQNIGKPIQRNWKWVPLSQISPYLIHSVVAAEDKEFFSHMGFNWESMWRAFKNNIKCGHIVMGGSSITQQLAKNLFLNPSRNIIRKAREALITYKLERELSKERILEIYLNTIEWGPGIYGAEKAAQIYFNKSAAELNLSESVRLASVLPNPLSYHPMDENGDSKRLRKNTLLNLLQNGWISKAAYVQTIEEISRPSDNYCQTRAAGLKLIPPPTLSPQLLNPDHWVSKLSDPDKIIMTAKEIQHFNNVSLLMSGGINIFGLPAFLPGKEISSTILEASRLDFFFSPASREEIESLIGNPYSAQTVKYMPEYHEYYDHENKIFNGPFYYKLMNKLNLKTIPDKVKVKYAIAVRRSSIFIWPEDGLVMNEPCDYEFDRNQQSALQPGTPVAVLHLSDDNRWTFIRTSYVDGWVKKEDLALTTREDAMTYPGQRFLIVTVPSARTASGVDLPLGTRVPLKRGSPRGYEITIPIRGESGDLMFSDDFLKLDFANEGFLPYTQRNVITQALKLLNKPFGWGMSRAGWDCSAFTRDTFSVFGINLPRHSSSQVKVGKEIAEFDGIMSETSKISTISHCKPGVTLLWMPGHIMMYLGEDEGKPYVIHSLSGVKDINNNLVKINKVAVTDLYIGGRGRSLLDRTECVSGIYTEPSGFRSLYKDFFRWLFSSHASFAISAFILFAVVAFAFVILGISLLKKTRMRTDK